MIWWNPFRLPNDELHFAPARRVHEDGNQLRVARAKDAMRPDGNSEETRLFITRLEDQLKHKGNSYDGTLKKELQNVFSLSGEGHGDMMMKMKKKIHDMLY